MNAGIKILLYLVLAVAALVSGRKAYSVYNQQTAAAARRFDTADTPTPAEAVPPTAGVPAPRATPDAVTNEADAVLAAPSTDLARSNAEPDAVPATPDAPVPAPSPGPAAVPRAVPTVGGGSANLGLYGAVCVLSIVGLGLLFGHDASQYLAQRGVQTLIDDDRAPSADPNYDRAEEAWANGEFLDAIAFLREFLKSNPRELHAKLRIAEIYEKDLNNPVAAALELEEVLTFKFNPDRWAWTAIHLANVYSGKLNQAQKAIAWLRRIDDEYDETAAAAKARERLDQLDARTADGAESAPGSPAAPAPAPAPASAPAPAPAPDDGRPKLPPGFRLKKR